MDGGLLALGLLFLLGGKKSQQSQQQQAAAAAVAQKGLDAADGQKLLARAHQAAAAQWAGVFMDAGATAPEAAALARWAGLESSGNPNPQPPGNGGGLMQVGKGFVDMGALTADQYARLTKSTTSAKENATLAIKYAHWLADQAARLVGAQLPNDPADRTWFAYYYHQRPVDVRDLVAPLAKQLSTTSARTLADVLGQTLTDPASLHRLRASNVVAFDAPGAS